MSAAPDLPLTGTLVLDATRMLPGAVLSRILADLGARVVKVEEPAGGDPMRHTPPLVDGIGTGFRVFFRGTESVCLDLRSREGAAALRRTARHADVLVESFRPGTMERWDLGYERLAAQSPALVYCSLSSFGSRGPLAARIGHDLNLAALSGILSQLPGDGVPRIQLADVTTGVLAATAILGALLVRHRSGRGMHIEQPLALGPMPFLAWAWADASVGAGANDLLAGAVPAYRLYTCRDGVRIALGALEPKFWQELVAAAGLPELAGMGLATGDRGEEAARTLAARIAQAPSTHWLRLAEEQGLPLSAVNTLERAMAEPYYGGLERVEGIHGGAALRVPGPFVAHWSRGRELREAPRLGEGTARVLAELGFSKEEIAAIAP